MGLGAISCAGGAAGNTEAGALTSLFSEPLSYQLSPASSAVDTVPASALSLPGGVAPSATDAAGNQRVVDGNGDCVAVQDKGALELQGHAAACPKAAVLPAAGIISALTISPSPFSAAPSGATISRKAKKKYGATISWRDSQAATTTFTVLRGLTGRTRGHSCTKPSKKNKHGKRCTYYSSVGTFTHADIAGANHVHFSGRIKGRRLAAGSYRLKALAHNAAGNGPAALKTFKIR